MKSKFLAGLLGKSFLIILGFSLVLYLYFPMGTLEIGARNLVNKRLAEPVFLGELNVRSLNEVEANVVLDLDRAAVAFPFRAKFSPFWNPSQLELVSPPKDSSSDKKSFPMQGTLRKDNRSASLTFENYPVSTLLPRQEGTVSGKFDGNLKKTITGEFTFDGSLPELANLPIYPPFVRGIRVEIFKGEGSVSGRTIRLNNMIFRSEKFALEGNLTANVRFPIQNTKLDVDLDVQQPVNQKIQRTLTLGDLGI